MQREIKFRAYDKEKKIMISDYEQGWARHYNLPLGSFLHNTVWRIGLYYNSLMQFTGFKDKADIDIYEGDILFIQYNKSYEEEDYLGAVKFDTELGSWIFQDINGDIEQLHEHDLKHAAIVGNVFENEDLLK